MMLVMMITLPTTKKIERPRMPKDRYPSEFGTLIDLQRFSHCGVGGGLVMTSPVKEGLVACSTMVYC